MKSTKVKSKSPIIVNKAKYILPARRTALKQNKLKSSKLHSAAIIGQLNNRLNEINVPSKESSIKDILVNKECKSDKLSSCGHDSPDSGQYVNHHLNYHPYNGYRESVFTKSKTVYKNNLNEEITRIYLEGNKNGLLSETKVKKNLSNEIDVKKKKKKDNKKTSSKQGQQKANKKSRTRKELEMLLMKRILLITNIIALIMGLTCLIAAGLIDPQPFHRVTTLGAQLTLTSIYIMFASLIALYGIRLRNYRFLFFYAYAIIFSLCLRSLVILVSIFFTTATIIIYSLFFAPLEIFLIFIAFAVGMEIKNSNKVKMQSPEIKV